MNERIARLREESFSKEPSISIERARLLTEFYRLHDGKFSTPVTRALSFQYRCERKNLFIGNDELIVGERGPAPKAVPTYPELTCHTRDDFQVLTSREKTWYRVDDSDIETYDNEVVPYWQGRSMRDKIFSHVPNAWEEAYAAGVFTEFMEQRAPGHTTLDGLIYENGLLDLKKKIAEAKAQLDFLSDSEATEKSEQLRAMDIACDASIIFAERHAILAEKMAQDEPNEERRNELGKIADVCRQVPAHAPRNFWEAIQMYWYESRTSRPAPRSLLRTGSLGWITRPRYSQGTAAVSLDQVQ
jgi:formate C-acetyltransferase